ncbi:AAEL012586-PA [Aedes aegypti]|uniref:AAEL012586-PA n=2 Tax=Aedes aegypti TaxID=7159 RepID=A0A1S4FWN0_AEDAE|nr:E3 ubiquitin-protein ligase TRIM33 [Aedes aegypti]EAT35235.1 AAEL012586-PA [Aedes aegypti]
MERGIGRQGPMMSSPGMSRRPGGGMPPRDSYQSHSSYHQQQQSSPHQHHQQSQQHQQQQQQHSPASQFQHSQHDELIRYIHEAWNTITQDKSQNPPVFFKSVPEPRLAGFTPFDLEAYWGRRLVHKINISAHGHQ